MMETKVGDGLEGSFVVSANESVVKEVGGWAAGGAHWSMIF